MYLKNRIIKAIVQLSYRLRKKNMFSRVDGKIFWDSSGEKKKQKQIKIESRNKKRERGD